MSKAIKIIRDTLEEIFDSFSIPDGLKEDNGLFTFTYNNIEYYVNITPFNLTTEYMVGDKKILNIINNANKKYIIDFGIIENGIRTYNVKTNFGNPIEIIRFIAGIILKFIEDNNVEVISYVPNSSVRDKMFDKMVNNFALDKFIRYRMKEITDYNIFLISKKLLNGKLQ